MKLSKKTESEIIAVNNTYWDSYIRGDWKKAVSFLDENIKMIGSTESEVYHNKKEATKFLKDSAPEIAGKIQMRNREVKIVTVDALVMINEQSDFYINSEEHWVFYAKARITSLLKKTKEGWKFIQQHGSIPDSKVQEGETIAFDKISKENQELKDTVKRRTVELEYKNRALEIEAALERVRARTMAMRKSEELAEVASLLFKQMALLGINTYSSGFNIWDLENNDLISWMCNADSSLNPSFRMPIKGDSWHSFQYKSWKKGKKFLVKDFTGKEMQSYFRYLKSFPLLNEAFNKSIAAGHPMPKRQVHHVANFSNGYLLFITLQPYPEAHDIFKRFAKVFDQTYTRFLDLQKAEAQIREAKIEAALERVRARTMAMHKSDELLQAGALLYQELFKLGISSLTSGYVLMDEDEKMGWNYLSNQLDGTAFDKPMGIPHQETEVMRAITQSWKKQNSFHIIQLDEAKTIAHQNYIAENTINFNMTAEALIAITPKHLALQTFNFKQGYLLIVGAEPLSEAQINMMLRFTKVFQQTYTRFLDLQKAEVQTREVQIEIGLERVRAEMMAMHKSDELRQVVGSVFTQLQILGFEAPACSMIIYNKDLSAEHWFTGMGHNVYPKSYKIPYVDNPYFTDLLNAWKKEIVFKEFSMEGKLKINYAEWLLEHSEFKNLPKEFKKEMLNPNRLILSDAFNRFGMIEIIGPESLPKQKISILKRFSKVFEQTYTRFLDLQKAEAQAREAQIELALERVRARTMSMQHSDELSEAAALLFQQVKSFGFKVWNCAFNIWEKDEKICTTWNAGNDNKLIAPFKIPLTEDPSFKLFYESRQKGESFYAEELSGKAIEKHYRYMLTLPSVIEIFNEREKAGFSVPKHQVNNIANFSHGNVMFITYEQVPKAHDIFKRFAKVFEQTYTRFLDLQKAEAQAREAKIEAALEKVRSRTMAMQHSDELPEAANVLFLEIQKLDIPAWSAGYCIWEEDKKSASCNMSSEGIIQKEFSLPSIGVGYDFYKPLKNGETFYVAELGGKKLEKHYDFMKTLPTIGEILEGFDKAGIALPTFQIFHIIYFTHGYLMFITYEKVPNAHDIFKRFTKVFDQTYIRFVDLQKAEKQTRAAQINLAVERVRAKALAMHKSEDIIHVVAKLKDELMNLDIPDIVAATIFLNEGNDKVRMWDLSSIEKLGGGFHVHLDITFKLKKTDPHLYVKRVWENQENYFVETQDKKGFKRIMAWLREHNKNQVADEVEEFIATTQLKRLYHAAKKLNNGKLCIDLLSPPSEEMEIILTKMGAAFDLAYKRFEDLQKAEKQAREAQIEVALERIRSRSMAMHKSKELAEVSSLLFQQMTSLGINTYSSGFNIWDQENNELISWMCNADGSINPPFRMPIRGYTWHAFQYKSWKKGEEFIIKDFTGEAMQSYFKYLRSFPLLDEAFKKSIAAGHPMPKRQVHHVANFSNGYLLFITLQPYPKAHDLFKRFAKVFDQTYTRFLDLQKAEAQAREAQIEAALERVRSRSMAMHKSEELLDVIGVISEQIIQLNLVFDSISFGMNNQKGDFKFWLASPGQPQPLLVEVPFIDNPVPNRVLKEQKKGVKFFADILTRKENRRWVEHMLKHTDLKHFPKKIKDYITESPGFARSTFFLNSINLFVGNYQARPFTESENNIFNRFAQVFEQSYTRFLDLQKAETQAREAQIEAALERVRSKTMAMHNSKDVGDTVATLFDELVKLGVDKSVRCGIAIINDTDLMELWAASSNEGGDVGLIVGSLDMTLHPLLVGVKKAWKKKKKSFTYELEGEDLIAYYTKINNSPDYPIQLDMDTLPEKIYHNSFYFPEGVLFSFAHNPIPDTVVQVFIRFAKVFSLTYRRFLDLQKAEEQARKATIEASLERVRSKAMAMHNSEDLVNTANQLFKEFQYLEISFIRCGVLKINENKTAEVYSYSQTKDNKAVAVFGNLKLTGHELLDAVFENWKLQKEFALGMKGDVVKRYYKLVTKQVKIPKIQLAKSHFAYGFYFPEGALYCFTNEKLSEDTLRILRKFNLVMGLTYRRYFELQEAESRELAAIKESSLDRVRAEIASMRTANDLNRITPLVWKELTILGVPFFRCGVFIIDKQNEKVHAYLSSPSGESLAALELDFDSLPLIKGVVSNWKKQKVYVEKWNKEQFIEFTQPLIEQGQINSNKKYQGGLDAPENLVLQMVPFKQGMLYVGSEDSLTNNHISMVESLARAFSVAYTRYEDFKELEAAKGRAEEALSELKSTQTQLIQSEKMASLGELTAGIAHEIQNPLNFVNNFSELSEELLEELQDEIKENSDEIVAEIFTDLKQNLNKITNHGKRASNIVKGMLDHSRTSSGIKEFTDINLLADEYLRLSYHGIRAKDKSFNAKFETDLDQTIPKIKIIAQDIGRVILNLINNAFYAVNQKKKKMVEGYQPTVNLITKKKTNAIEIIVKDNGGGISKENCKKIFQPFFTTKPTGQGTGLGLSLSYDIITKGHGGELRVTTKEGKGTSFTIQLNINDKK